MCGFGELVGPLATGASVEYLGAQGFVLSLTTTLAVYIVLIVSLKSRAATEMATVRRVS